MNTKPPVISSITIHDLNEVEAMSAEAFGPGRFTRSAFRLREGVPHEPQLSFVARIGRKLVGSVEVTRILIGGDIALLLGPLVVSPTHKNTGIGALLMKRAVAAAREDQYGCMVLVGDLAYYQRFGFEITARGNILLPGPVDLDRLLICALQPGTADDLKGTAVRIIVS